MTDVIEEIRTLHRPTGDLWLRCGGCDVEGWESEEPDWPCRTAELVYGADEIETFKQKARDNQAQREATFAADPSPTANLIPNVWQQRLLAQLNANPLTQIILNTPRQT